MDMLEQVRKTIDQFIPFLEGKKFLLAVSGGVDSVVLAQLFFDLRINFSVAHCNFNLRGNDSDSDEQFVKSLTEKLEVPFFVKSFNTISKSEENGISIQMAARELRYEWFSELVAKNKFDFIVTAHHRNDQVETFFINLIRGSGIDGLCGMKILEDKLFRPLLFVSKDEILQYAATKKITWREDSSNAANDYLRNQLRHDILPLFEKINPSFYATIADTTERLSETAKLFKSEIDKKRKKLLRKNEFGYELSLSALYDEPSPALILFECLRTFGFRFTTIKNILADHHEKSGKKFFSATHRAVDHRGTLLITRITPEEVEVYEITREERLIETPLPLRLNYLPVSAGIEKVKSVVCLDADLLKFPLTIRRWHKGDFFVPFGMKGRKKLSDYFIDNKFSLIDKENAWVICSGDQIVWLVGHRQDERFKITEKTENMLRIELLG